MDITAIRIQAFDRDAQRHMLFLLHQLCYDDALVWQAKTLLKHQREKVFRLEYNRRGKQRCGRPDALWRLEYRKPMTGEPHYLLSRAGKPVGIQYVTYPEWAHEVKQSLSIYLSAIGFTAENTRFEIGGARTSPTYVHNRLPSLVEFQGIHRVIKGDMP